MKHLLSKLKGEFKELKGSFVYLELFKDITELAEFGLSTNEIELFLDVTLSDFDENFYNTYFKQYANLYSTLNVIQLSTYISFAETLKKDILTSAIKKLIYPIFLLVMAFITLYIFRHSLLDVMSDFISVKLSVLVNLVYYLSLTTLICLFIFSLFFVIMFKNPVTTIITYHHFQRLFILSIIESYYLSLFTYLLLTFYKDGYSTLEIFKLINRFKGDRIISNLAYFVNSDLEEGMGIEESINNMNVNENFKKVLKFSLKSDKLLVLLKQYSNQLNYTINHKLSRLSRIIYSLSYVYIGVVVLLLYKVLSLPLNMLSEF